MNDLRTKKGELMALTGIRTFALAALSAAALLVLASPSNSFAGKDHCRTLLIDGSAGETSTDSVVFQLVDENGGTVINQSCQVTVQESEAAASFGERLTIQWGNNVKTPGDPPCPSDAEAIVLATKSNGTIKFPKKLCSDSNGGAGPSCKIKFTHKVKKSTLEVKKGPQLDICCWEGPECKGAKWGTTTDNPINLQVRNNSVSLSFLPIAATLPAAIGAASDLVVDPIGIEQLPVPEIQECRQAITNDVAKLTNRINSVLSTCHLAQSVPDQSICNTVSPASDPTGLVSAAVIALRQEVRDACAALGSPAKLSYAECPAPCGGLIAGPECFGGPNNGLSCRTDAECDSEKRCSAGTLGSACTIDGDCLVSGVCLGSGFCAGPICTVDADCDTVPGNGKCVRKGDGVCKDRCAAPGATAGNPCGVDADCDSVPSAGDGRCADWGEVGDCAACLTRNSIEAAMLTLFGASGSTIGSLTPEAQDCKSWLTQIMGQLLKLELKETSSCQKLLDGGKTALPTAARKCKDADRKGKRAKAVAAILNTLQSGKQCGGVIPELDSCGNDAATLGACLVAAVKAVNQAYGVAAIPDSRCGDGKRIGEQCDDGNTTAGDGCAADCTCEGSCGDGTRNPLSVCGELCDDGNSTNGDGCDNNCTPTSCGNGIITAGEQCEADSDCPAGQPCNNCLCGGSGTSCPTAMLWETQSDGGVASATEYDFGWSGVFHGADRVAGAQVKLGLDCGAGSPPACGSCSITGIDPAPGNCRCANDNSVVCSQPFTAAAECGGTLCECYLSPPQALSAGGVALCSLPLLASEVSGSWNVEGGGGSANWDELSLVRLGVSLGQPCPLCVGDPTPNDGVRGGTCSGGPDNGSPCDVNGTGPTFGAVSYDCLPDPAVNVSGAGLVMKRTESTGSRTLADTATTGAAACGLGGVLDCHCAVCSADNTVACNTDADCTAVGAGTCSSDGLGASRMPNNCSNDSFVCTDDGDGVHGHCSATVDSFCDLFLRANGSGVVGCLTNGDCLAQGSACPGGDCGVCALTQNRSCFLPAINAAGVPNPGNPISVGIVCVAPTVSPAANAVIGLSGPARSVTQRTVTFE